MRTERSLAERCDPKHARVCSSVLQSPRFFVSCAVALRARLNHIRQHTSSVLQSPLFFVSCARICLPGLFVPTVSSIGAAILCLVLILARFHLAGTVCRSVSAVLAYTIVSQVKAPVAHGIAFLFAVTSFLVPAFPRGSPLKRPAAMAMPSLSSDEQVLQAVLDYVRQNEGKFPSAHRADSRLLYFKYKRACKRTDLSPAATALKEAITVARGQAARVQHAAALVARMASRGEVIGDNASPGAKAARKRPREAPPVRAGPKMAWSTVAPGGSTGEKMP